MGHSLASEQLQLTLQAPLQNYLYHSVYWGLLCSVQGVLLPFSALVDPKSELNSQI